MMEQKEKKRLSLRVFVTGAFYIYLFLSWITLLFSNQHIYIFSRGERAIQLLLSLHHYITYFVILLFSCSRHFMGPFFVLVSFTQLRCKLSFHTKKKRKKRHHVVVQCKLFVQFQNIILYCICIIFIFVFFFLFIMYLFFHVYHMFFIDDIFFVFMIYFQMSLQFSGSLF